MKGVEHAVAFIIVLIVALIVLWVLYVWIINAKEAGATTVDMAVLRQCCSDRAKWPLPCDTLRPALEAVECDLPGDKTDNLFNLAEKLHVKTSDLPDYCYCNT